MYKQCFSCTNMGCCVGKQNAALLDIGTSDNYCELDSPYPLVAPDETESYYGQSDCVI